jgi:hypothetical protein
MFAAELAFRQKNGMRELYKSPYFDVQLDGDLVRVKRSSVPFPTIDAVVAENMAIEKAMVDLDVASLLFLGDLRDGPLRNDPEFETANKRIRELTGRFRKTALLLKTAVGALQITRLARTRGDGGSVFHDEAEALEFLRAK